MPEPTVIPSIDTRLSRVEAQLEELQLQVRDLLRRVQPLDDPLARREESAPDV